MPGPKARSPGNGTAPVTLDPDSQQWKDAVVAARRKFESKGLDPAFLEVGFREMEREARERAAHLRSYWVQPHAAVPDCRIGVASYSPQHAARIVRTYVFPFERIREPFGITPVDAAATSAPRCFEPDIWQPEFPRNDSKVGAGRLRMPWLKPNADDAAQVLDVLVANGFELLDVPGVESRGGDAWFDDPGFEGREPREPIKLAIVLSSLGRGMTDSVLASWALDMDGPLDESWDDDEGIVEPRLIALDGPLPEEHRAHLTAWKYNVW